MLRSQALGLSLAVHAAGVLVLAALLGAGHHHHEHEDEAPPARLVWIEPAAPPPPVAGAAPAALAPVVEAEEPPAPRVVEPETAPLVRAAPKRPARRTAPLTRTAPEAVPEAPAVPPPAAVMGVQRGVPGGAPGGVAGGLGDAPLALSAVASPPELVERVVPEYPTRARALEVEGQVLLEVVLDRSGRPEPAMRVLRSIALLDEAAMTAVRQWRFRPARDAEGRPVRVVMEVPVRFVLR